MMRERQGTGTHPPLSLARTLVEIDRRPRSSRIERAGWRVAAVLALLLVLLGVYTWDLHANAVATARTTAIRGGR
jgi:hypothetical protein